MNRKIDSAFEQRVFDLFREQTFVADFFEWSTLEPVAGGSYDLDSAFAPKGLEQTLDMIRLPER
jgi:hypothetical protein